MSSSRADKALETAKALNELMKFPKEDQANVLETIEDYFIEREDSEGDSEDDCEMESTGNNTTTENK